MQRGLELVDEVRRDLVVEVLDAERLLDLLDAVLGGGDGALLLVDLVVDVAAEAADDAGELVVELGASATRPQMMSGVRASSMRIESTSSTMA